MRKKTSLPKLPYGQGSFSIRDDKVVYRKRIKLEDGSFKNGVVYGDTPNECMEKMKAAEKELKRTLTPPSKEVLCDELYKWLEQVKKPNLKSQSYTRLRSTIKNQIEPSNIGHMLYQNIHPQDIQEVINALALTYAKTSVKKVYDCLNDFYRYVSVLYKFDNPMLLVQMPRKTSLAETRQIDFFDDEDIDRFIKESKRTWNTGSPKYQGGVMYAANIYLGMRMGELLALQWKDIDFENKVIYVSKTLIEENNPDYNPDNPNSKKVRFVIQETNKTNNNRYIPINSKAEELIRLHMSRCIYKGSNDFVISTRNRKTTTIKNAADTIKKIEENAELKVQNTGTHVLRHTCASLYFRKGIEVEIVAKILGHSPEVCRSTYIHFIEDQLQEAAKLIEIVDI